MPYQIVHRKWLLRPWMWVLMPLELAGLVPLLVLFGIAQPDLYRTKLWEIGHYYGFNSDPRMILYAYANYEPYPNVPFVWTRTLTDFNVAISVITLFVLLVKLITFIMKFWFPMLAAGINLAMVTLYTVSVYGQMGPDHADPRYHSNVAWYIAKSCDYARPFRAYKSCQLAKGTFASQYTCSRCTWLTWPSRCTCAGRTRETGRARSRKTGATVGAGALRRITSRRESGR